MAQRIGSGLRAPDGSALPFECGFTFGEQAWFMWGVGKMPYI